MNRQAIALARDFLGEALHRLEVLPADMVTTSRVADYTQRRIRAARDILVEELKEGVKDDKGKSQKGI